MSLSTRFIQLDWNNEPKSKRSKLTENNDFKSEWIQDVTCRWIENTCTRCKNKECILRHILVFKDLQPEGKSTFDPGELVIKSFVELLINQPLINGALNIENLTLFKNIFRGCECLLSNLKVHQFFKSNLKCLALFAKSFLDFEFLVLNSQNIEIKLLALNFLSHFINHYLQIFKQFTHKELFVINFLDGILSSLCNLRKFVEIECPNIDSELDRCIQNLLFARAFHSQYKNYVENNEVIPSKLFSTLKRIAKSDSDVNCVVFEVVFRVAVKFYDSDTKVIYLLFKNMIECSGRDKNVFIKLLNCLNSSHLDMNHKIENLTLSEFLKNYLNEILSQENLKELDYKIITGIFNVNPLMINVNLEDILMRILPKKSNVNKSTYNSLFIEILNASISFRRENKFISQLLSAIRKILFKNPDRKIVILLSSEFLDKFMLSITNSNVSQTITVLRSLIFHLKLCCVEEAFSFFPKSTAVTLKLIAQIINSFMKGIKICDFFRNSNAQKKFSSALIELGKNFSLIIDRISELKSSEKLIFTLMEALQAWNDVFNLISHYVCDLGSDDLSNEWLNLVEKIELITKDVSEDLASKSPQALFINLIKDEKLIDSLNLKAPFCASIIKKRPRIILKLKESQISNMLETLDFLEISDNLIRSEENVQFVILLLNQVILKIQHIIKSKSTRRFIREIIDNHYNWSDIISKVKRGNLLEKQLELSENIEKRDVKLMRKYLSSLSSFNLSHLHRDMRTVIFILIILITSEFPGDLKISRKSNEILLELLQENDIDLFQFSNIKFLNMIPLNKEIMSQIFELPLKNDSFNSLIRFIKLNKHEHEIIFAFLCALQRIKFHRNCQDTKTLRDLIEKLSQSSKNEVVYFTVNIMKLYSDLRAAVVDKKINDELKERTNQTLSDILKNSKKDSKYSEDYQYFLELILRNRSCLGISDENMKGISVLILKDPHKDVLRPFLETESPEELELFLVCLETQTISALKEKNIELLRKSFLIWEYIFIIEMSDKRNKIRLTAMNKLLLPIGKFDIPDEQWLYFIRLFKTIVSSKFIQISDKTMDIILIFSINCLQQVGVHVCRDILSLYTVIVKLKTDLVKEKISFLLLINKEVVKVLCDEGKKLSEMNDWYQLECIILDLEKFVIALNKFKENSPEIYPLLLSDLLDWYSVQTVPKNLDNSFQIIVQHLLSHCEHEMIQFLNRTLPPHKQKIFKELVIVYRKHYKFIGKI